MFYNPENMDRKIRQRDYSKMITNLISMDGFNSYTNRLHTILSWNLWENIHKTHLPFCLTHIYTE